MSDGSINDLALPGLEARLAPEPTVSLAANKGANVSLSYVRTNSPSVIVPLGMRTLRTFTPQLVRLLVSRKLDSWFVLRSLLERRLVALAGCARS